MVSVFFFVFLIHWEFVFCWTYFILVISFKFIHNLHNTQVIRFSIVYRQCQVPQSLTVAPIHVLSCQLLVVYNTIWYTSSILQHFDMFLRLLTIDHFHQSVWCIHFLKNISAFIHFHLYVVHVYVKDIMKTCFEKGKHF